MTKTPSKLYRKTEGLPRPLIRIQIGSAETGGARFFYDDDIQSVKIIHGSSGPDPSVTPTRCEIHVKGELEELHGHVIYVFGSSGLAGGNEQWRFMGRISTQTVQRGPSPEKSSTVIQASSYAALATGSNLTVGLGADWGMRDVLNTLVTKMKAISDGEVQWVEPHIHHHDKTYEVEWTTVSSALKKYVSDLGYRTHILRYGYLEFRDLNRLQWEAEDAANNNSILSGEAPRLTYPIERRQVLAPMDLVQTTENNKIGVKMERRDATGAVKAGVWTFGEGWQETDDLSVTEWVELDWLHIKWDSPHYQNAVNAEASRLFRSAYYSPDVKIDLLQLLDPAPRGRTADEITRDGLLADGLYALQVGDWLPFGRDWLYPYRGVKYVTGFTETITPSSWTFDVTVHPPQHIIGRYGVEGDPEPEITSYAWDRYDAGFNTYSGWTFAEMNGNTFDQFRDLGD